MSLLLPWIAANSLGMLAFVYLGVPLWGQSAEHGPEAVFYPGTMFHFLTLQAPLLVLFLLLNLVVVVLLPRAGRNRYREAAPAVFWLLAVAWAIAQGVDGLMF